MLRTTEAAATDGPVIVLGSTGLLGQALMREAARRGLRAVGLSRRKREGIDLSWVAALGPVLAPLAPAFVINAAAQTGLEGCERNPGAAYAINARLPALLAQCGVERGLRWVHVSTDHFWCGSSNVLHDEHAPVTLVNEYARSKYAGEASARTDPGCLVLRTNIVGRRGWDGMPTFAEWVLESLDSGQPFDAYRDVWSSSIEVGQFACALFDLVERGARGMLNVASRESVSKAQFIHAFAAASGRDPECARVVPRPAKFSPARASSMGLDVTRAEQWLGRALPTAAEVATALACSFTDSPAHVAA